MLTLAIPKGRIWNEAQGLLQKIGCAPDDVALQSRSLIVPTADANVRLIVVRAQDAPTYVACAAADAGIAGGDILAESDVQGIYQSLDLGIARCRLIAAAPIGFSFNHRRRKITVASKYVNLARRYFSQQGISAHYIKLHGTMELAPLVGLADVIVDVAETGDTLRANQLNEVATIHRFSAMLIINRRRARKNSQLTALLQQLSALVSTAA